MTRQAQIVREINTTGYSLNNRPRHKLVRVPTALAVGPIITGAPALLLLQLGGTVPAAVLGLVALVQFVWACARVEVIWR